MLMMGNRVGLPPFAFRGPQQSTRTVTPFRYCHIMMIKIATLKVESKLLNKYRKLLNNYRKSNKSNNIINIINLSREAQGIKK